MIFAKDQIAPLLKGAITLTVRPAKTETCPFGWGHSYAVKSSAKGQEIARIKIATTRKQLLHQVTDEQAVQAGYADRQALFDSWRGQYGEGPGTDLYVVEIPVWLVYFELDPERKTTYLRPGPRGGYTTNPAEAMDDEWCPPKDFVDQQVRQARETDRHRKRAEAKRGAEELRDQITNLRQWGAEHHVDVRSELRVLERRLQEKLRRRQAA